MRLEVHGRPDTLCATCRAGTVTTDERGRVEVYCAEINRRVRQRIVSCTDYKKRLAPGEQSRNDLENIAWIVTTSRTGQIGFVRPGTEAHKAVRREPWDE